MSEPLFKVGDVVAVRSTIAPQYDQDKTTIVSAVYHHTWGAQYQVEGQPDMNLWYREVSIKPYVEPLANEEILTLFLKQHRKYAAFKRNVKYNTSDMFNDKEPDVGRAISSTFCWESAKEGINKWRVISYKWRNMCKDLNIEGKVNINLIK